MNAAIGVVVTAFLVVGCGPRNENPTTRRTSWAAYMFDDGKIAACSGGIAFQRWTYEAGASAVLVFANGRTEYTDRDHHLIEMFDRPWDIVMFDHYGQGRSDGPRAHADDFDAQYVCDMKAVIDQLVDPTLPLVVMGHSLGGFVGTRLAQIYPDIADVYVFSSPMYGIPTQGLSAGSVKAIAQAAVQSGDGQKPYVEMGEKETCEENRTTHDCDYYDAWLDDDYVWIGPPTYGWLYAAMVGFEELFSDTDKQQTPMLVMQAGDDRWVLPDKQNELCDAVATCSLTVFDDFYHELFHEIERQQVVERAVAFVDGVIGPQQQ